MSALKFVQAKNYTVANRTAVDLVVVHSEEYPEKSTAAEWCADFFAGRNGLTAPAASAHYTVDNDSIVQCVLDKDIAWHAKSANPRSIGVEHSGYAKQTEAEWLDAYGVAMLERSAELVARLCRKYNIPPVRPSVAELKAGARGVVGHKDCTDALENGVGHWDPGSGFPWAWYLERVRAHLEIDTQIAEAIAVPEGWAEVTCNGALWHVSSVPIAPIGIGAAEEYAKAYGCELPTPALVDAIWQAADLKIDAAKMPLAHDGTPATMSSPAAYNKQAERIEKAIAGRPYKLLAGTHKDVVIKDGKIGLYGWHRLDGSVIQPFYAGHARGWADYSQGLRLCKRVG